MPSFILRRIVSLVFVLLIAVTVTFCLLRLAPGSPLSLGEKQASAETIAAQERKFDLDGSIGWQCVRYLGLAKKTSGHRSGLLQANLQPCLKYKDRTVS